MPRDIDASFNRWMGKSVEISDWSAPFQCMDWAGQYLADIGIPYSAIRNPAAYQVCGNFNSDYLQKVSSPQKGDLVVFNQSVGPYGHIAVVDNWPKTVDQNWNGVQKVTRETHWDSSVACFLRPKTLKQEEKEDMAISQANHKNKIQLIKWYIYAITGVAHSDDDILKYHFYQDAAEVNEDVRKALANEFYTYDHSKKFEDQEYFNQGLQAYKDRYDLQPSAKQIDEWKEEVKKKAQARVSIPELRKELMKAR